MHFGSIVMTGIGLSMDAFAVAISKGLLVKKPTLRDYLIIGAWFGIFQGAMPLVGYYLGESFAKFIDSFSDLLAFAILAFIGIHGIIDAVRGKDEINASLSAKSMFPLALATNIDALAVGVTFSLMKGENIFIACLTLGLIGFGFAVLGLKIGTRAGQRFAKPAQIIGGIILVLLGVESLLEHYVPHWPSLL